MHAFKNLISNMCSVIWQKIVNELLFYNVVCLKVLAVLCTLFLLITLMSWVELWRGPIVFVFGGK